MPEASLTAALARRVRAAPAMAGSCRVVAIDGPSGAGKSTLAAALAAELGAQVVHVDDLIPGWDGLTAGPQVVARDILAPISQGRDGGFRRYDWDNRVYAERWPVPVAPYLVVEGCASGVGPAAAYLALLVWVDAPKELRFERGMERDGETFRPYWERWETQSQALWAADGTAARADVVVDGSGAEPHRSEG